MAGYGTRETSGYSIKVNDVYTGDNALYIDLNLIGPAAGEAVNEVDTYPVIVLRWRDVKKALFLKCRMYRRSVCETQNRKYS